MGAVMLEGVDMDEDLTLAGETAQAPAADEYYWTVTGVGAAEGAELAWSKTEEYALDDVDPGRRHWPVWAALVLILCLVAGAAVWLGTVFYQERWATPEPPVVAPDPPPVAPPAPLPTSGPPAQHEQAPPQPDPDQQFLAQVSLIPGASVTNGDQLITSTKVMCTELQNGASPEAEIEGTIRNTGISRVQAEELFDAGTTIYCPQFAHR